MAETSTKGKSSLSDWRLKNLTKIPTCKELAALRCPFEISILEPQDYIPDEYTRNLKHLILGQDSAPWTGYYATYQGAKLAVSNLFGVWFKIELQGNKWAATCPTQESLKLKHEALEGINVPELIKSGEPLPASRAPSHTPSHISNIKTDPKRDQPMRALIGQSTEMECQPPQKPRGTGDNPFGVDNLESEASLAITNAGTRLEGIPPDQYEGDRSKTMSFLTQFKRFMLMN
jgi:hypothetical protein